MDPESPLAMDPITDSVDGSFQLQPDARRVQSARLTGILIAGAGLATFLVFPLLAVVHGQPIYLLGGLGYLLVAAASDWIVWKAVRPPVLKADAIEVTYSQGFAAGSVLRANFGTVFQGQMQRSPGRASSSWQKTYCFVTPSGTVEFSVPAAWFEPDAMRAFAYRLGIPVRGDFTTRVTTSVPEVAAT